MWNLLPGWPRSKVLYVILQKVLVVLPKVLVWYLMWWKWDLSKVKTTFSFYLYLNVTHVNTLLVWPVPFNGNFTCILLSVLFVQVNWLCKHILKPSLISLRPEVLKTTQLILLAIFLLFVEFKSWMISFVFLVWLLPTLLLMILLKLLAMINARENKITVVQSLTKTLKKNIFMVCVLHTEIISTPKLVVRYMMTKRKPISMFCSCILPKSCWSLWIFLQCYCWRAKWWTWSGKKVFQLKKIVRIKIQLKTKYKSRSMDQWTKIKMVA